MRYTDLKTRELENLDKHYSGKEDIIGVHSGRGRCGIDLPSTGLLIRSYDLSSLRSINYGGHVVAYRV